MLTYSSMGLKIRYWSIFHFYAPQKHQKTFRFLKFSGSIENEYWPETGLVNGHKCCAEGNKIPIPLLKTIPSYQ